MLQGLKMVCPTIHSMGTHLFSQNSASLSVPWCVPRHPSFPLRYRSAVRCLLLLSLRLPLAARCPWLDVVQGCGWDWFNGSPLHSPSQQKGERSIGGKHAVASPILEAVGLENALIQDVELSAISTAPESAAVFAPLKEGRRSGINERVEMPSRPANEKSEVCRVPRGGPLGDWEPPQTTLVDRIGQLTKAMHILE
jgi:hypothetical protein